MSHQTDTLEISLEEAFEHIATDEVNEWELADHYATALQTPGITPIPPSEMVELLDTIDREEEVLEDSWGTVHVVRLADGNICVFGGETVDAGSTASGIWHVVPTRDSIPKQLFS